MSAIDSTINWLTRQIESAGDQIESMSDAWLAKVESLKAKAHDFSNILERLKLKGEKLPENSVLKKSYKETINEAEKVKKAIQLITGKVDEAARGLDFLGMPKLDALFLAPVPLGIISSAITILSVQIAKMLSEERRIDAALAAGGDPNQVITTTGNGVLENITSNLLKKPLLIIGIGTIAWLAWPEIKQKWLK